MRVTEALCIRASGIFGPHTESGIEMLSFQKSATNLSGREGGPNP